MKTSLLPTIASLALLAAVTPALAGAPTAEDVLGRAAGFHLSQDRAKATITSNLSESVRDMSRNQSGDGTIAHVRPSRLLIDLSTPFSRSFLLSDGASYTVSKGGEDAPYSTLDGEFDLSAALTGKKALHALFLSGPEAVATAFFTGDPLAVLQEKADSIEYETTTEPTEDRPAFHVLRATTADYDLLLSFSTEDPPLLHRVELDLTANLAESHAKGQLPHGLTPDDIKLEATVDYEWVFGEDVSDELFAFEPSPNRPKARSITGAIGLTQESSPSAALAGSKVEEPIVLTRADNGETVTIGGETGGAPAVILNFWASWCGPCRMAMPHMDKLAADLADEGVAVYAVNFGESRDQVTKYMESNDYGSLQFLLDEEGKAAQAYRVTGVPQVNLLDREGTILGVYHGFSFFVPDILSEEVQALASQTAAD